MTIKVPKGDYKFAMNLIRGVGLTTIILYALEVLVTIIDFLVTTMSNPTSNSDEFAKMAYI